MSEPKQSRKRSRSLTCRLKPGQTGEAATAEMLVEGVATNTVTTAEYSRWLFGDLDLTEAMAALGTLARETQHGDAGRLEELLAAQAVTLNAIFANLAHRATHAQYVDHLDRFLRLALKAQSQCRATVATLGLLRNPVVFAKQANIAHGPQQVNNTLAHAGTSQIVPNELLEAHGQRLDTRAAGTPVGGDQNMAALEPVHRSEDACRQGAGRAERQSRASAGAAPGAGAAPAGPAQALTGAYRRQTIQRSPCP